jgi:hypothetical protein
MTKTMRDDDCCMSMLFVFSICNEASFNCLTYDCELLHGKKIHSTEQPTSLFTGIDMVTTHL